MWTLLGDRLSNDDYTLLSFKTQVSGVDMQLKFLMLSDSESQKVLMGRQACTPIAAWEWLTVNNIGELKSGDARVKTL